jgi:hypothetical protein
MAQPTNRQEFTEYCLRQLGAPVLEINVDIDQVEDRIDDAVQYFQERHFDGIELTYMKYKLTQEDVDRAKGKINPITTTTSSAGKNYELQQDRNYIQMPDYVLGVNRIFKFEGTNTLSSNMFSIKYQLFLNDLYYWGSTELLSYTMVKRYLEDIDWILSTEKPIRFNKREGKLYIDVDWETMTVDSYILIECYRALNPADSYKVWNDSFLKRYATALIKRQWGTNLLKFRGVKLPGGVELNGREIYDDAQRELDLIREEMSSTYEMPPLDLVG